MDPEQTEAKPSSIGRWMILMAWLVLLALLTMLFSNVLEQQENPNRELVLQQDAAGNPQVVLQRNRSGHYVASGEINGYPVTFLLDTGATDVALSEALAERIGLRKGRSLMSRTANGTVRSWATRLDEVALGAIRMRDVRASILPGMMEHQVLLGMSFLKRLEMIQRGNELTLRQY